MQTILIVDDEESIRSLLREVLEDEGYRVVCAAHGQEGLRVLQEEHPILVLSDVMMPIMDGRAFCKAMCSNPEYQHIPLVLMSAGSVPFPRLECHYASFIHKPFDIMTVVTTIATLIS